MAVSPGNAVVTTPPVPKPASRLPLEVKRSTTMLKVPFGEPGGFSTLPTTTILPSDWRVIAPASKEGCACTIPPAPKVRSRLPLGRKRAAPKLMPATMSPLDCSATPFTEVLLVFRPVTTSPPVPKVVFRLPGAVAAAALPAVPASGRPIRLVSIARLLPRSRRERCR
jgi:hypothetical protein